MENKALFSINKGIPIAYSSLGHIVHTTEPQYDTEVGESDKDVLDFIDNLSDFEVKKLINKLSKGKRNIDLEEYICAGNEELFPYIDCKNRFVMYVCAQSGAGKSTFCSEVIKKYIESCKSEGKKPKIFLLSRVPEDDVLDKLPITRIALDEEFTLDPIHPQELKDSLVIADDCDTIPDKKLKEAVNKLINDIAEIGRHYNVSLIKVSHVINKGNESKIILNEASHYILFPHGSTRRALDYVLKSYVGCDTKDIDKIMKIPSRYFVVTRKFPTSIMHKKGAYFINH